ncbi:MAG: SET domain-containing protein-lysine N-methyltransferase [Candidatus Pelagibacter sp.]|nr:SET domain-containing protein-lysine N-methyltransferase [Candidatus Pelagibacter sp.]|tara:strand:- start:28199 stop:28678 length:480 start_codon:yes stop_codon:yes gene_type:complete
MPKFIWKKSKINNLGLFAGRDFKKGKKVIEYKGKKYTHKQVEEDDRYDNSKAIYLFILNKKLVLDGDIRLNIAKYINHSCNPNCEVDIIKGKIWILAIQDIKIGDELSYDYGFGYDKDYKQFRCKCGSKNCCGYIVRDDQRWRINRKFAKTKHQKNKLK